MRLARARDAQGTIVHGIVEGESLALIDGDLLGDRRRTGTTVPLAALTLLAPIRPANLLCIGKNYLAHAQEGGDEAPPAPLLFIKATTTLNDPGAAIVLPPVAPDEVDYEAELAVVIGRTAKDVPRERALAHVLGYTCANDVSARDCQRGDGQWARGKSFDGFAPLGPWIETDLDPTRTRVRLRLNGRTLQDATTDLMIFDVATIISYLSRSLTLLPGTVILTGTPAGVGFAQKPPVFLRAGDRVAVEIDGIGVLENRIAAAAAAAGAKA